MRIVRFEDNDGVSQWGKLVDSDMACPLRGQLFGDHSFADEPVRVVRLLAPIEPPNIFAIGLNYADHAREGGARKIPDEPLVFLKATTAVIGPDDPIVLPVSAPDEVDFEAELAVVIGRRTRRVSRDEALDCVLGFTCANDVSARDCQKHRDRQWARAKSFDTFCPLGPAVVTPDEIDCRRLAVRSTLNGRLMQDGNTADMIHPVATLVSFLSHQFTLLPGTVILTGTPAGVGFARTPPVFLRPGDHIAVEIEGIGILENVVADAASD